MDIYGIQKVTLLDYPDKVACTVFTGGCNFKCPFCHNKLLIGEVPAEPVMEEEEFFKFLDSRKGLLDGVCISGGEPLVQPDLEDFIKGIKERGFLVKLDTNGSYPERLRNLVEKGLIDYVAMDIKNSRRKYGKTAGLDIAPLIAIEEAVKYLLGDPVDYEFRTTVLRDFHEEEDFNEIAQWIKGGKRYFIQNFEDSDGVLVPGLSPYEKEDLEKFADILRETMEYVEIRGI